MTPELEKDLITAGVLSEPLQPCQGVKHHVPQPFVVRPYTLYAGGPQVWLCGNCREVLNGVWVLLQHHNGLLPWSVSRSIGNSLLDLGMKSWKVSRMADA